MDNTLYTKLSGDSTLGALVSTRIYPVEPANDTTLPYVVYSRGVTEDFTDLSGTSALKRYEYIIDYWSINKDTSDSVAAALFSLLQGWRSGSVQAAFRVSQASQEEEFRNGQAFHGQSVYQIWS